jgi:murein DD-endopeptidase MepM/ murein hydrolase activator NlpD
MATPAQFPIDGKPGKDWKVTSRMGWRIHPVSKVKKHHNGTDIISKHEPCWIEAPYAGKVIAVGNNPSGFGNSVTLRHNIKGVAYVTVYAHMKNGSIKVKKGQFIEAGTPLGKMGTTGVSTGKHLHWELQVGMKWVWNAKGKGFIEPVAFFDALIKWEASIATAPVETPEDAPVAPAPTHDDAGAKAVATAPVEPVVAPATPAAPVVKPVLKVGSKGAYVKAVQKKIGTVADGAFGPNTKKAVIAFQTKHGLPATGVVDALTWEALG